MTMTRFLLEWIGLEDGGPADPRPFYQAGPASVRALVLLALLPALLSIAACERGSPAPPGEPLGGREASEGLPEARVASLSPLATRFVRAIGAGDRLVPGRSLEQALALEPGLLLVDEAPEPGHPEVAALLQRGGRVVEFAPHDLEDAIALVREVGGELVGGARAARFEAAFSRPLAKVGGTSRGRSRPRVVAVVDLDPLVIAGGHSFETDLVEIAGGHSVTHPGEAHRLEIGADVWSELAPDLVLVIGERPASERDARAVRNALPPHSAVEFFDFDASFWLDDDPAAPARRLRTLIEERTSEP